MTSSNSNLSTSSTSFSALTPPSGTSNTTLSEPPKISSSTASLAKLQEIITQTDRAARLDKDLENNRASLTQAFALASESEAKSNQSASKVSKVNSFSPKPYFD